MASVNGEEFVPEEVRDQTFKELRLVNKNNICIDCSKKNPIWTSIHLGVHLCIDCAGKHRQYGVMYSFVKSANLDKWNKKQLLFLQKGGNLRALQYFTKCGVISDTHTTIDYKSPIVQRYKGILTAQVEAEINGKPANTNVKEPSNKKTEKVEMEQENQSSAINAPKEIPNAETVQQQEKGKKKNKKKVGKKINLEDFDNLVLDDGVPIEEKQKIVKAYQANSTITQTQNEQKTDEVNHEHSSSKAQHPLQPTANEVKEMSEEQTKQKLEQLRAKPNVKSISSQQFKDASISNDILQQNLSKFQGSQSISSNAFFGGQDHTVDQGSVDKIKDFVADAGQKIYNKLSGYWSKK